MLNEESDIKINLYVYDSFYPGTMSKSLKTYVIPDDMSFDFKLPESTKKIVINEVINEVKETTLVNLLISEYSDFENLKNKDYIIDDDKGIIGWAYLRAEENPILLYERSGNIVKLTHELQDGEIVIQNLKDAENYIRRLSVEVSSLEKTAQRVKKLLSNPNKY